MKLRVPVSVAFAAITIAAVIAAYFGHRAGSGNAAPEQPPGKVSVTGWVHPWPRLPRYQPTSGWAALPARRHPVPVVASVSPEVGEGTSTESETNETPYTPPPESTPSSSGGGSSGTREFGITYTR